MPIPGKWWSCNHPADRIVLLKDEAAGDNFYACNKCGLVEGEADLNEQVVKERLREQAGLDE